MTLAVLGWIAPASPGPAPSTCAADGGQPQFCANVPTFPPLVDPAIRALDQARPCEELTGTRPSFCLVLPIPGNADPALLGVRRQDACAQLAPGEAPGFCLAPPSPADTSIGALQRQVALVQLRQRLGPEFHRAGSGPVDLWAQTGSTEAVLKAIHATLVADARSVETYFARPFHDPPAVFLFTSRQSFALALEQQFGFSVATAGLLSRQYGGVVIAGIDAVVINGEGFLARGGKTSVFRHELAHVAIHQLTGAVIPAWIDEGLATLVASEDFDVQRAAALSILATDPRALALFNEDQSWLDANASLGGYGYGVAAEAARQVLEHIGIAGVTAMLESVGRGMAWPVAFQDKMGEPVTTFVTALPARALGGCPRGVGVSAGRPDGLVLWHTYGFAPRTALDVTVDGPGHYAFGVTTDGRGVYSGTLGTPMPAGTYTVRVASAAGETAQLVVHVGSVTSASAHGC